MPGTQPRRLCPICNAPNDDGVRYCNACGSQMSPPGLAAPLAAAPVIAPANLAPAVAPPIPPANMAPAAAPGNAGAAIAPVRVLDVVPATHVKDTLRVCGRCRGSCDAVAQFCKFCGASLADAVLVASQSGSSPALPLRQDLTPTPAAVDRAAAEAALRPAMRAPAIAPSPAITLDPPVTGGRQLSAATGKGRLVIVARDGGEGPSFPLHDVVDIGRSEGTIVIAEDGYLSPRHIRIFRKGGKLFVRDLGSTNGFFLRLSSSSPLVNPILNGAANHARLGSVPPPVQEGVGPQEASFPLRDQDLFLVGQQVIRFEVVRDGGEGLGPAMEHGTLLFGTPATPRYARLSQRTVEGVTRDVFYLRKRETVFGRESGDIVFTEDPFLSRRHAAIRVLDHGRFALCDLGSSNGTFLQVRGEVPIFDTDQFRIGQQLFRVDLTQDAEVAHEAHVGAGVRP